MTNSGHCCSESAPMRSPCRMARRKTGNSALRSRPCLIGRGAAADQSPYPRPVAAAPYPGTGAGEEHSDPAAVCAIAGARPQITLRIDPRLNDVDGLLAQTVYRVIQEGATNVLRHANAGAMSVEAAIEGPQVSVEISDDGVGFPSDQPFGRGLTGMHERVRALSGTFEFKRENGRTYIRCRLPAGE